jgi:hypothetical protein
MSEYEYSLSSMNQTPRLPSILVGIMISNDKWVRERAREIGHKLEILRV